MHNHSIPTDEEKRLLEKWEAEMSKSTYDTSIIIPAGKLVTKSISDDAKLNFLDTKKEDLKLEINKL